MQRRRRWLFLAVLCTMAGCSAELLYRAFLTTKVGPRILLYGTPWHRNQSDEVRIVATREKVGVTITDQAEAADVHTVDNATNQLGSYFKFYPGETKVDHDIDSGESFEVVMNSRGFRGPDFEDTKAPGTIRVATLGSSSTFGYYNRDEDTYPVRLQEILEAECDSGVRYEVLNLAIPHLTTANILALLQKEVMALEPDVITFYEGINDSKEAVEGALLEDESGPLDALREALTGHFTLALFVEHLTQPSTLMFTSGALERALVVRGTVFIDNLEAMRALVTGRGATFIVANQQAQARSWYPKPAAERQRRRGITYGDELASIQRSLAVDGSLTGFEYYFLVHAHLMDRLQTWARETQTPFVDVIDALDPRRDLLLTWVHLHPDANRIIARELADEILARTCDPRS